MSVRSMLRGREIRLVRGEWVYADTGEPTVETWRERPCGHCGMSDTPEGHDGCLGTLPGVMNACCGHGDEGDAYVQFSPDVTVRGEEAISAIERLRERPDWRDRLRAWWFGLECGAVSPPDAVTGVTFVCNRTLHRRGKHKDEGRFHRVTWPNREHPTDSKNESSETPQPQRTQPDRPA